LPRGVGAGRGGPGFGGVKFYEVFISDEERRQFEKSGMTSRAWLSGLASVKRQGDPTLWRQDKRKHDGNYSADENGKRFAHKIGEQTRGALVQHRKALSAGLVAESAGQPRLADTGRSDEAKMMMVTDPFAARKLEEESPVEHSAYS
jgi:hypothetical protein